MSNKRPGLALLLDSAPLTWTSQEDRHLLLCKELSRNGFQPVLIFSSQLNPELEQRFLSAGAAVKTLSYQTGMLTFCRGLKKIFRDYNVILVHIIFFDYFSLVAWLVRATGIKRIVYEMQNSGIFRATSWKRILLRARTALMTVPMTQVIAISEFVKEQLLKAGVPREKIIVRYLGVDIHRFTPDAAAREAWRKEFALRPDEIILSTVSYLRPFKNPDLLVHACRELKARNLKARLFVAGDGEMLPQLKNLTRELDVNDYIYWLGNVADPKTLLQASDVFLLASTGEAFGLVLAEAMACGVPVVGSRSGSLPEVVKDGETGILFTPYDFRGLADAIALLEKNPTLKRSMGKTSIDRVGQLFNVEQAVRETLTIYEKITQR